MRISPSKCSNRAFTTSASSSPDERTSSISRTVLILLLFSLFQSVPISILCNRVTADAGDLVPGFGSGGMVTTDFAQGNDAANALTATLRGKIIAAGSATVPGKGTDFALACYDENGNLDLNFGVGGKTTTDFFGGNDGARGIVVQPDGKVVVSGFATSGAKRVFAISRYLENGALDSSFDGDGKVTLDLGSTSEAFKLALQSDGKIVVVGDSRLQTSLDFTLVRLNQLDGSPDGSFGAGGVRRIDFGFTDRAIDVAIDNDNIFACGIVVKSATQSDFGLARISTNGGSRDELTITTNFFSQLAGAQTIKMRDAVPPVNRRHLIVGGYATVPGSITSDFAVAAYDFNGVLIDTLFDDGKGVVDFRGGRDLMFDVDFEPNGDIVGSGWAGDGANFNLGIARWNRKGKLDSSWGLQGRVELDTASGANNVAFDAVPFNGGIVAAGVGLNPATGNDDFNVVKIEEQKLYTFTKRAPPTAVVEGDTITFTFEITNLAENPNPIGFFIKDSLPSTVTFLESGNEGWLPGSDGAFTKFVSVPAGGTVTTSIRVRANESGTFSNEALLYQLISGSDEIAIYGSDDVEFEVKDPSPLAITGVTRLGKNLRVSISDSFSADPSGASMENVMPSQAQCPTILIDGQEQNTLVDPDNPTTALIAKKGFKRITPGQTVIVKVRFCNGTETVGVPFTRPQ